MIQVGVEVVLTIVDVQRRSTPAPHRYPSEASTAPVRPICPRLHERGHIKESIEIVVFIRILERPRGGSRGVLTFTFTLRSRKNLAEMIGYLAGYII